MGSRGDSETYVRSKKKACEEIGIKSYGTDLSEDVSQEELLKVQILLVDLAKSGTVDGTVHHSST